MTRVPPEGLVKAMCRVAGLDYPASARLGLVRARWWCAVVLSWDVGRAVVSGGESPAGAECEVRLFQDAAELGRWQPARVVPPPRQPHVGRAAGLLRGAHHGTSCRLVVRLPHEIPPVPPPPVRPVAAAIVCNRATAAAAAAAAAAASCCGGEETALVSEGDGE